MPTQSLHCIILCAMIRISTINRYSYINMAKLCIHLIYYYAFYSLHRVVLCRCDWYIPRLIIGCGINIFYLFYFILSGGGGWSGRAVAQWRPRVSKLGLKGLSDYHSNETAVEAARRGASGPNKRATLIKYLLKKESLKTALSFTEKGQKAARQMKSTLHKKEKLLTLTPGDVADGRRLRR